MSDIGNVFDKAVSSPSFFNPDAETKKKNVPNIKGDYFGHMIEAEQKEVEFERDGSKYKAIVYNYKFVVHKNNSFNSYANGDDTISGAEYVGRKFNANGVWRFLEPSKDDDFDSNQGGNKAYFRFCETIGLECPEKEVEVDGEKVMVKELPLISIEDINNKAIIAFIDKGKPYTDKKTGAQKTPHVVKFVKKWEDGEDLTDEIPF